MPTFRTTLLRTGGTNVGIEVPPEVIAELNAGARPAVTVTLKGHTYASRVGVMRGLSLIPVNAATRAASGAEGGEELEVTVELDAAPREVEVPADAAAVLESAGLRAAFDALAPSRRKEHVRSIEDAKTPETRERRIAKLVETLRG